MEAKELAKRFAARLRVLLDAKGWKQTELADKAGMSRGNVTRHLSGTHAPSGATLAKLASVFGVDPCELICEPKKKK